MKRREFTLVELLTVIAIIAILAGLLLPALGRAMGSGRATACASNQKQFGMAFDMFAKAHNDYYPPAFLADSANNPSNLYTQMALGGGLGDLGQRRKAPITLQEQGIGFPHLLKTYGVTDDLATCPTGGSKPAANNDNFMASGNYGMNVWVGGGNTAASLQQLTRPSAVYAMMDMGCLYTPMVAPDTPDAKYTIVVDELGSYPAYIPGTAEIPVTPPKTRQVNITKAPTTEFGRTDFASGRHSKTVNVLYGDGHSAPQTPTQINDAAYDGNSGAWSLNGR